MTTISPTPASHSLYGSEHEQFRDSIRAFLAREISPNLDRWNEQRLVDRSAWKAAGSYGFIGIGVPTEFRRRRGARLPLPRGADRGTRTGVGGFLVGAGFSVHDDVFLPYVLALATPEQKRRWLPSCCTGETIGTIAMTEPGAGSDLRGIATTAVRDGDDWVLNGSKTFITNGIQAGLVIVVAYTDRSAGAKGISLLMVESGMPGFSRGRKLDKVGLTRRIPPNCSSTMSASRPRMCWAKSARDSAT